MKILISEIEFSWEEEGLDYNCLDLPEELEICVTDVDMDDIEGEIYEYLYDRYGSYETPDNEYIFLTVEGFKYRVL